MSRISKRDWRRMGGLRNSDLFRVVTALALGVELAVITDDESWVDLNVGQACTVLGKLESVGYGNPGTLIVAFADWSQLVLECENPRAAKHVPLSEQVRVRAIRTEDGLRATVMLREGSVPVPLVNPTP